MDSSTAVVTSATAADAAGSNIEAEVQAALPSTVVAVEHALTTDNKLADEVKAIEVMDSQSTVIIEPQQQHERGTQDEKVAENAKEIASTTVTPDHLSDVKLEPAAVEPAKESVPTESGAEASVPIPIPVAQPVNATLASTDPAASATTATVTIPVASDAATATVTPNPDAPAPAAPAATAVESSPPTAAAPATASPPSSGWGWFSWGKKKTPEEEAAEAAAEEEKKRAKAQKEEDERKAKEERAARAEAVAAEMWEKHEAAIKARADAKAEADRRAKEEAEAAMDHLGGTTHSWMHSLVRYSLNKLFGFEEWEEGMEEQYRNVLCREMVTMEADMHLKVDQPAAANTAEKSSADSSSGDDDEKDPQLILEMSHFYPAGAHKTPLPVIIMRTPYDRALMRHTAERICQHGYHVVIQDTRNSPNAAALRTKQRLALVTAEKFKKAVDKAANAIREQYKSNTPKSGGRKLSEATPPSAGSSPATTTTTLAVTSIAVPPADPNAPDPLAPESSSSSSTSIIPSSTSTVEVQSTSKTSQNSFPAMTSTPQEFFPIVHESTDGFATIDWVSKQPWCDGNVSFYGASYLGIAQYAVVDHKHPALKCIVPVASASRVFNILYPEGSLNLDLAARWLFIMFHPSVTGPTMTADAGKEVEPAVPGFFARSYARVVGSRSVIPKALNHLPACELDKLVTEKTLAFYQEMIQHGHDESSPFWTEKQVKLCDLQNSPPLLIIEGWYDLFLQQALRDYVEALAIYKDFQKKIANGEVTQEEVDAMPPSVKKFRPYLTIINCVHIDFKQLYRISLHESIIWYDFHLKPNQTKQQRLIDRPEEKSVRVQMINASAGNEERHKGLIAKRKKEEKALATKIGPAGLASLGTSDQSISTAGVDQHLLDLLSPRSKARWRQGLLDAEWRYFPEFPPPKSRGVAFYLHCETDEKGVERRILRTQSPADMQQLRAEAERIRQSRLQNSMQQIVHKLADKVVEKELQQEAGAASAVAAAVDEKKPDTAASEATAASSSPAPSASPSASTKSSARALPNLSINVASSPKASPPPQITSRYSCYTYDPRDPTPSVGGTCFDVENCGALDNRVIENRSDVLVFTSEPLTTPLVVIGFVRCTLYVRSNTPCTDFIGRLCDVYPLDEWATRDDFKRGSGKSQILCDGLFKVTPQKLDGITVEKGQDVKKPSPEVCSKSPTNHLLHIDIRPAAPVAATEEATSSSEPADLVKLHFGPPEDIVPFTLPFFPINEPDTSTPLLKLDIDMWATGNVFQVGHRIRFHVCSAAHPRWLRSLGGPDPMFCGVDQAVLQHQSVYHDEKFASFLSLPVLSE